MSKIGKLVLILLAVFALASSGWAAERPIAVPFSDGAFTPVFVTMRTDRSLDDPGDIVNWNTALISGGDYLKHMQADITEDNAGNGSGGSETPNDPDDGGWDWVVDADTAPYFHTTASSSPNMFGVQALGLYHAYVNNGYAPAAWFTSLTDAANAILANPLRRDASALKFLMLYNDLPSVSGTAYKDDARAKYDGRIAVAGSATIFASNLRDTRGITQGYPNGIIGWDLGAYVVAAQMLYDRFGGTYDSDADAIAEVLYQDSYASNPGLFDIVADAGWDPLYANPNYWMYTLGVTGLLDAFSASGSHIAEIPGLVARLQASQYSDGGFSYCYGANTNDADWQSTAYSVLSLQDFDAATYATEIAHGAYWTAATQHVSGGWLYGDNSHYPEVGAENLGAISFGGAANEVWVDDNWTDQTSVDAANLGLVWGYDAFGSITDGINAVSGSIVNVANGDYYEVLDISLANLHLIGNVADPSQVRIHAGGLGGYGSPLQGINITASGVTLKGFTLYGGGQNINSNPRYGIKYTYVTNCTVEDVVVREFNRSGLEFYGSNTVVCTDFSAIDNGGAGLVLRAVNGAVVTNTTTSNNIWGGVRVQSSSPAGGVSGIVFGGTNSFGENSGIGGIYTEQDPPGLPITVGYTPASMVQVLPTDFAYILKGAGDLATLQGRLYQTLSNAANAALTVFNTQLSTAFIERISNGEYYVEPGMKIGAAVNGAVAGGIINVAAGTFTESVNVNKYVKIIGQGSVLASLTTVTSSTGPVFTIAASGLNIANPLLFQDLQVLPIGQYGFNVPSGSFSYVKLNNVRVIGTNPNNFLESEVGLKIATYASLSNLEVINSAFDHLAYGWYVAKHDDWGPGGSMFSNVTVTGTSFSFNDAKGLYVEKLTDATFTGCEVNSNGLCTACFNATFNAGFDINLKGQESYQNISVSYCDFEGNAIGKAQGMAAGFKARGSGTDGGGGGAYQLHPASLTNVQVSNCKVASNERGLRFGEPGQANTLPANSIVTDCAVYGNTNGDVINATTAAQDAGGNWWGTATPNWGTQVIGSNVNHTPWYGVNGTYPNPGFIPLSGGIAGEMSDAYIGCGGSCNTTTLYLKLGVAGLPNLQVVFQLPAGFAAGPLGTVTPLSNDDPNLIQAFASDLGGGQIQVDMGFNSPYSTGDLTKYVAAIPLTNTGAGTGVYNVTGISSLWIDGLGGNHVNDYTMTPVTINVDCTVPVINSFTTSATCAFGNSTQTIDAFSVNLTDGLSNLDEAWITFAPGGGTFSLFGANQTSPYTATFPSAGNAAAFYALLANNACNTLTLHLTDAECNVAATVDLANVGRDEVAPSLSVATTIPPNYCFNNNSLTANYGGAYLDDYVDITSLLGANPCMAASGTLTISHAGLADYVVALDKTNYPSDNSEALALWTWMLGLPAIANSNGGSFTFDVKAADCAGNLSSTLQFTICVDTDTPDNSVTAFDARPAHLGVWLKWSWTASPDAQEMRIYRSPLSGEYPSYASALWNSNSNYDVSQIDPSGWTLVATQSALTGTITSASYGANNNNGGFYTHVSGGTYWLDSEDGWDDGDGNASTYRDIYRYVTFVKDAGGNWSVGAPVSMTVNADRSTNYWLGDFSTADGAGLPGSRGRVDSDDLGLLSPVYFTAAGGYRNIGPVNTPVENGNIGKGIPKPTDNLINFSDLVPFSFNYGMVGPVTNPLEFVIEPGVADVRPFNRLDEMPSVSIGMDSEIQLTEGTEFTVTVTMSGNEGNAVKAAEAILEFNPSLLDFVSATMGNIAAPEGTMFSKASLIEGVNGQVGFVAASCGGWSTLSGSAVLGTVTFRIKSEINAACNISLSSVKLLDNSGEVVEPEGNVISVLNAAALPDNYALYQNYPNPFNPTTNIQFDLKESGHVKIQVFNTLGQMVTTVVDRDMVAGRHDVTFDASSMASGLYMYSISVNGFSDLKKMVLIR